MAATKLAAQSNIPTLETLITAVEAEITRLKLDINTQISANPAVDVTTQKDEKAAKELELKGYNNTLKTTREQLREINSHKDLTTKKTSLEAQLPKLNTTFQEQKTKIHDDHWSAEFKIPEKARSIPWTA